MKHFYFASCAAAQEGGGVYHYVRQGDTLVFRDKLSCDRPMYLEIDANEMHILLLAPYEHERSSRVKFSGLVSCAIGPDGSLARPCESVCTRGVVACHLCRYQGNTYAVNYLSGNVFGTNGALDVHQGKGVDAKRQDSAHTHFVAPGPRGNDLLCTDLGLDAVYCYDASLRVLSVAHVPAGHGARHLAYIDNTVFCANELGNTVTVFSYDDHRLTPVETVPALMRPVEGNTAAAIRTVKNWIYVSNRGDDSVSCLRWQNGRLALKNVVPVGGQSPRDFLVADDWLLATNEKSNTVTVLYGGDEQWRNTGLALSMPKPLCVAAQER